MNPCNTPPPISLGIIEPCAMLPHLRQALFELIGGKARARVRMGEQELAFHPANIAELRKEITKLEQMCHANGTPNNGPRAVLVGHRRLADGYGQSYSPFNRYR